MDKKQEIDRAKKLVDMSDDKITKSDVKGLEEELGDDDDYDEKMTMGGRSKK